MCRRPELVLLSILFLARKNAFVEKLVVLSSVESIVADCLRRRSSYIGVLHVAHVIGIIDLFNWFKFFLFINSVVLIFIDQDRIVLFEIIA